MPRSWVGYPSRRPKGCGMQSPSGPKVYPKLRYILQSIYPKYIGVWHFTLRFVLPRSWVGYPSRRPKGCGMQSPSGPKVYPNPAHRHAAAARQCCPPIPGYPVIAAKLERAMNATDIRGPGA